MFYQGIKQGVNVKDYIIVDNNELGLYKTKELHKEDENLTLINEDILNMKTEIKADVIFSVGLIEHFSEEDTAKVIQTHFDLLKEGGFCIITYPTPTMSYRVVRKILEVFGLWIFYDERPLKKREVFKTIQDRAIILKYSRNDLILLSQGVVVSQNKKG